MLRGSAVLLTGAAAGALMTSRTADPATAADVSLSVTGDELEVRENRIAAVWLDVTADWTYEVPHEESPDTLVVDLLAGTDSDAMDVVASDDSEQLFLDASGDESFQVDLLDAGVLESDDLVPATEGASDSTTVHVGVELRLLDANELVIAADAATDTATLTIERSDYDPSEYGAVSGSGELTVELE